VTVAVRELHALEHAGAATFLLSCGARLYAHRMGRALFAASRSGLAVVASEPLTTDDAWHELAERELVVVDRTTLAPRAVAA
jgi:predicted glutamine amidotransferase